MKKIVLALAIVVFTLASCKNGKTESTTPENTVETTTEVETPAIDEQLQTNIVRFTIANHRQDCTGVMKMKCLLVKEGDSEEWTNFYSPIEGFEYEEGYEYVIDVKTEDIENPPADSSSIKYTLVEQISKEKK